MNGLLAGGQEKAEEFLRHSVAVWVDEGRITEAEGNALVASMSTPAVASGLVHLGAHFAMSIPLRSPFGSIARFFYTLAFRIRSEIAGLTRRGAAKAGRAVHTVPVMLFALLPGFGRLAYFASPALAGEGMLMIIPLDFVSRKLPFRVYERFHLAALFLFWARPNNGATSSKRFNLRALLGSVAKGLGRLRPHLAPIAAVLILNAVLVGIGAYKYLDGGREDKGWFEERNVIAVLDVTQMLIAGLAGIAAYWAFWSGRGRTIASEGSAEAYGTFLWLGGGLGLLFFAIEDYFSVHEELGDTFESMLGWLPVPTNAADDIFILGYAFVAVCTLYIFRTEMVAPRASSVLLVLASISSIVMVLTDAFADSLALRALESPSQTLAATLLMCAFVIRYWEVRQPVATISAPVRERQVAP